MNSEHQPILVMIQGTSPGERWELDTTRVLSIGRSSRNTIQLLNPSVSRFHCEIAFSNGLWYISDLNSRKGTYLNGIAIEDRDVLKPGDVIRISGNLLRFTEAQELEELGMDFDEMAESGVDLEQGNRKASGLVSSKDAVLRMKFKNVPNVAVKTAKKLLIPLLAALICWGLSHIILSNAKAHVREKLEAIKHREKQVEDKYGVIEDTFRQRDSKDIEHVKLLNLLEEIAEKYSAYPEAHKAAQLYAEVEIDYFSSQMEKVYQLIFDEQYKQAVRILQDLMNIIRIPKLRNRLRSELRTLERFYGVDLDAAGQEDERDPEKKEQLPESPEDTEDEELDSETPSEQELLDSMDPPPLF